MLPLTIRRDTEYLLSYITGEHIVSEFVKLEIDLKRCLGIKKCGACIRVCPVNVFFSSDGYPKLVEENEDECTLCNLCLQSCEVDAITLQKSYED